MNCPVCKIELHDFLYKDLKQCPKCSILRKDPLPSKDQIKATIKTFMLSACRIPSKAKDRIAKADFYLKKLEKFVPPSTLYDIGAAGGFVMKAAKNRGWNVRGNELSLAQINYAKRTFNFDIEYGFIEELNMPKCNAIIMWHTLEHMIDPDEIIKLCHKNLIDKGCIHIQVPYKRDIKKDYEPWHMVEFSPQSIRNILQTNGFEVIEFELEQTNMTILGRKK